MRSVTVTVYLTARKPLASGPVPPVGNHDYKYGGVAPDAITEANPSEPPGQFTSVVLFVAVNIEPVTAKLLVAMQPSTSVTSTV